MKYYATVNEQKYTIEIDQEEQILVDGQPYQVNFQQLLQGGTLSLLINNRSLEAIVSEQEDAWEVLIHGELYTVQVQDERSYRLSQARGSVLPETGTVTVKSPMPGVILDVLVAPGTRVEKGEKVVILESMKMENELLAGRAGVVKRIHVEKGASVEKNQDLLVIGDPDEETEGA